MKKIISSIGVMLACIGICGLVSVFVQFIVFRDMPPTALSLVSGALLTALGFVIYNVNKKYYKD